MIETLGVLAQVFWNKPSSSPVQNQTATSSIGLFILILVVVGIIIYAIVKAANSGSLSGVPRASVNTLSGERLANRAYPKTRSAP
jgi:hypothetical protein